MSRYDDIDMQYSRTEVRRVRRLEEPKSPFLWWGLAPWLGVLALSVYSCTAIQERTEANVERDLAARNLDWVEARASGRTVTLTGTPPSVEAERAVTRIANDASDNDWMYIPFEPVDVIRKFDRPSTIEAPTQTGETNGEPASGAPADANWNFTLANRVITLNGEVPDEATRLDIITAAQKSVETPTVRAIEDKLVVLNAPAPEGYRDVALAGVRAISRCDEGIVAFRDRILSIDCEIPRSAEAEIRRDLGNTIAYGSLGEVKLTATEDVNACEGSLSSLLRQTKIQFETGSAEIDADSRAIITRISDAAKTCPGTLRIEGHTDNTGSVEKNNELSAERAEAVRTALVQNGVDANRLVSEGFGSRQPAATNNTREGRAMNRRIEIKVVGPNE